MYLYDLGHTLSHSFEQVENLVEWFIPVYHT